MSRRSEVLPLADMEDPTRVMRPRDARTEPLPPLVPVPGADF